MQQIKYQISYYNQHNTIEDISKVQIDFPVDKYILVENTEINQLGRIVRLQNNIIDVITLPSKRKYYFWIGYSMYASDQRPIYPLRVIEKIIIDDDGNAKKEILGFQKIKSNNGGIYYAN